MEMIVDVRSQVQKCLQLLAEREGFHRIDADFGRELARTESLSPAHVLVAAKLLRQYQLQLSTSGLIVPDEGIVTSWAAEHTRLNDDEMKVLLSDVTPSLEPIITPINKVEDGTQASELVKEEPINLVSVRYGRIFVEFPFNQSKVNALRPLKDGVEDWAFNRYKRNEWSYPLEAADVVFEALRAFHDFTYSPEVITMVMHAYQKRVLERQVSDLEEHWHELAQIAALEAVQSYLDGAPTANGQRLFRHQREAVQRMIEAQRFILALDMGLGKSKASLIAAQAYDLPIWVIAPAGTIMNWQREAAAADVEITLYSWAKLPEPPEDLDYVLIVDEAHYAQGGEETIRGQGFLKLSAPARAVFMLSGTPIKNSLPINLWPLLVAAKHPLAADKSAYERQYCGAYFRSVGRKRTAYDTSGASNLDELHERIRDVILYRKKSECVDLPEKLRVPRLAEVSKAGEIAYRKTIERLREAHLERMADKYEALRVGREELLGEGTEESDLGAFESEFAFALVELGIYRHAASLAKVENAVEIALDAREQGQGVLLFTAFRDTAERLATKLDADCLTGEVTRTRKQAMIDRFQAQESKILVATIGAGGIGINLTAAQVVIMVDRAWTPTDVAQAEDRAHRIGQHHNVTSIWLQYGPVDDKIDQLLELKQDRIETILSGRSKNLRGMPGIRALAKEIMESVHTGKSLAEILGLDPDEFEQKAVDLVRDPVALPIWPGESTDVSEREKPKSQVVKVVGSSTMRKYLQELVDDDLDSVPPAYERIVKQRQITFQCMQCRKTVTQWHYPSRGPRYCSDECRDEAHKEQTRERVRRYRERKAAQQP
jgi:2-oxo-4-hydroxy-4-carboxy--5-ureidoimidazoline (OHCU) decarboxylase